ncbi:MAG TPA: GDP-mannose 4,6-dehydratase [Tepidisphaeraceae bacterium]|nr:GDP-mannose 4,6-dehydratase [Tepidisphaeraceae bacterium]
MSSALIIGAGGQDGRLLTEQLSAHGWQVRGLLRERGGDLMLSNPRAMREFLVSVNPIHIYYLAAHHHSAQDRPPEPAELFRASAAAHVDGFVNVLEAMRLDAPQARLFYAASSHCFGSHPPTPVQDEATPLIPDNIYGITKTAGVHLCRYYRNDFGLFASVGFLYNHESPYRRPEFVTSKIIRAAIDISRGKRDLLVLGDLSAQVDWGWAPDYVDAMARILRLDCPDDFVIATGEPHTVGEFAQLAFAGVGLDWREHVEENPGIITKRKLGLVGNPAKLKAATGWSPTVTFEQMIRRLLEQHQMNGSA